MQRILLVLAAACGGSSGTPAVDAPDNPIPDAAELDAAMGAFALTSPAYGEGTAIPVTHTCDGANTSPQLAWSASPSAALSYAVVFTDKTNGLVHWAIWDIPSSAAGLPANVAKLFMPSNVAGAKQTSYQMATKGYLGPCPPSGTTHTYEHVVYAIDVATLPGTMMSTTPAQAKTIIEAHDLATAQLAGTYTRP